MTLLDPSSYPYHQRGVMQDLIRDGPDWQDVQDIRGLRLINPLRF